MKRAFAAAIGVTFGAAAIFAPTPGHAVATYGSYTYGVLVLSSVTGTGTVESIYTVDGDTANQTGAATSSTGSGGYVDGTGPFGIPAGPLAVGSYAGTEAFVSGSATNGASDAEILTTTSLTLTNTGSTTMMVTFDLFATFEITTTAGNPGDTATGGGAIAVVDMDLQQGDPGYFLYDDFRFAVDNGSVMDFPAVMPLLTIDVAIGQTRTIGFFVDAFGDAQAAITADIPLPAALPLLAVAIGALGFVGRRRRPAA